MNSVVFKNGVSWIGLELVQYSLCYMIFFWLLVTSATSDIKVGKLDLHFTFLLFSFKTQISGGSYNFMETMNTL